MSFATTVNIVTIILCIAVLVQCARMMRSLAALKSADLPATVAALDTATGQARLVLSELKDVLRNDADPNMRALSEAQAIRDELSVMVGIANATADRLLESSAVARAVTAAAGEAEVTA
jgi:hypothetical protein